MFWFNRGKDMVDTRLHIDKVLNYLLEDRFRLQGKSDNILYTITEEKDAAKFKPGLEQLILHGINNVEPKTAVILLNLLRKYRPYRIMKLRYGIEAVDNIVVLCKGIGPYDWVALMFNYASYLGGRVEGRPGRYVLRLFLPERLIGQFTQGELVEAQRVSGWYDNLIIHIPGMGETCADLNIVRKVFQ